MNSGLKKRKTPSSAPTSPSKDIQNIDITPLTPTQYRPTTTTTSTTTYNSLNTEENSAFENKNTPKQNPSLHEETIFIHEERAKKKEVCYHYFSKPDELLKIIKEIIYQYQQKNVVSFSEFKELWKYKMDTLGPFFESQHIYPDVIHILYYGVLGFTLLDLPINGKVSIIYSLYCLYNCQITNPRVPIIITLNYWETLLQYFEDIKNQTLYEGYQAFRFLRKMGAFVFSATLHPISTMNYFKTNSMQTNQPIIPHEIINNDPIKPLRNIKELKQITEQYNLAKRGPNNTIPESLNLINDNFYNEVFSSIDQNTIDKFAQMIQDRIPGFP
ncbi:hypothetical protein DICPUDRAFT_46763 [Dictyostelium purpureum]|uniref:Uncharacterized protein n=1 Tax=Dictyostelium purpureum TaxID=5786 RepID=F0ZG62_DICPU|nr:uncharacterized protein DICPUDRAFT_46763 [Dictyostelium purpureum]EGC37046.1 hypothetical protein DICPUDRAFT_46763 [Dictyostelium purpureum]|eukprot:XP_003286403.1 hypothetical protein DICPUDRAFT_46763 [Dictyostelium purpureum]